MADDSTRIPGAMPLSVEVYNPDDFVMGEFTRLAQRDGFPATVEVQLAGQVTIGQIQEHLGAGWRIFRYHAETSHTSPEPKRLQAILMREDGVAAHFNGSGQPPEITFLARSPEEGNALAADLLARTEPPAPEKEDRIRVVFSYQGRHGPRQVGRSVVAPEWAEIAANYPAAVASAMGDLIRITSPEGGKLVLFHGPPGTGKTFATRALLQAWRGWADPFYILDPEVLIRQPEYLLDALTFSDEEEPSKSESARWRVLVLEDADDFVTVDAKSRNGPAAMSRLLNSLDGLLGQGLRVILLMSTNERLEAVQPAIARPGRCLAKLEFAPHSEAEAMAWCEAKGLRPYESGVRTERAGFRRDGDTGSVTLAELFEHQRRG